MKFDPEYYSDPARGLHNSYRTRVLFCLNVLMLAVNLALTVALVVGMLRLKNLDLTPKNTSFSTETTLTEQTTD